MTRLEARLASLAAAGETVTYGELAKELGLRIGALTAELEALMEADQAAGMPIRAALCVSRLNRESPAEGFFLKALALGIDIPDRAAFVMAQRLELQRRHG
jgi:hypothetical protein